MRAGHLLQLAPLTPIPSNAQECDTCPRCSATILPEHDTFPVFWNGTWRTVHVAEICEAELGHSVRVTLTVHYTGP